MGVTGINCVCNVARPNQDVLPAGCLVKNYLGALLPSVESKTLRCHWALPDTEGRELCALRSLVKAHRCEERLLSISGILRNDLYASTHTFWLLNPKPNIALFVIFHPKNGFSRCKLLFSPSLFLNISNFWFWRNRKRVFLSQDILPSLLHRQTKTPSKQKERTQLPHVYQNILSISPSPLACVCVAGLIKSS